jgi:4-amino-4-deoxy-L-arabinose transferase-like glycosyltransferase
MTFFFGLGSLALVGPDEPRYAQVAREMYVSGDYVSPTLCGCHWFEKPVLLYWLEVASYHVFGVNEWSARFPSALLATITVLLLMFGLRELLGQRRALFSAVVLGSMAIFFVYSRAAATDMMLAGTMSLSLIFAYLAISGQSRIRTRYWIASVCAAGLTVLAKGLAGPLFIALILGVFLLITGRLRIIRLRHLLIAALAIILVSGMWLLPITLRHGWHFIEEFFIQHHFERFTSNRFSHPGPIYYFIVVLLAGALPWTFFFVPAVKRALRLSPRQNREDSLLLFAWVWVLIPLVFFSLSESKLPGYLLPVFPAVAIILGYEVERTWTAERGLVSRITELVTPILLIVLGVALIVYVRKQVADLSSAMLVLSWLPVVLGSVLSLLVILGKRRALVGGTVLVIVSIIVAAVNVLFPWANEAESLRRLSLEGAASLRPGEKMAFFLMKEYAPVFYAQGRVACRPGMGSAVNATSVRALADVLEDEQSLLVFTTTDWIGRLESDQSLIVEHLGLERRFFLFLSSHRNRFLEEKDNA